jgi:hypothetical protein
MTSDDVLDVEHLEANAPPEFARRQIELPPQTVLGSDDLVDWDGAIVFVTAGEIELACAGGARARFRRGDIICLAPFPTRVVRNVCTDPARLLAIWRHAGPFGRTG